MTCLVLKLCLITGAIMFPLKTLRAEHMQIKVKNTTYSVSLEDNNTTKALVKKLPLTLNMSDLHGNEKYYYFENSFPVTPETIGQINAGDIMLFGDDCLVIFYKPFKTSYAYTRIGYIDNPSHLKDVLGSKNITVTFQRKE